MDYQRTIIVGIIVGVLSGLYSLYKKSLDNQLLANEQGDYLLRHSAVLRNFIIGLTSFIIFGLIFLILTVPFKSSTDIFLCIFMSSMFMSLALYLLFDLVLMRIVVNDGSIRMKSGLRKECEIQWTDIDTITYSNWNSSFYLQAYNRQKIRVSSYLVGFSEFEKRMRANLYREKYFEAIGKYEQNRTNNPL